MMLENERQVTILHTHPFPLREAGVSNRMLIVQKGHMFCFELRENIELALPSSLLGSKLMIGLRCGGVVLAVLGVVCSKRTTLRFPPT